MIDADLIEDDARDLFEEIRQREDLQTTWEQVPEWAKNLFRLAARNPGGFAAVWVNRASNGQLQ